MEAKEIPPPYRLSLCFGATAVSISRAVPVWVDSIQIPRPLSRLAAICREMPVVPRIGTAACRDLERELKAEDDDSFVVDESEKN